MDGRRALLSLFGRGLAAGVVSMTLTAAVVFAIGLLVGSLPCHAPERGCMSGFAAVGVMVLSAPVMLAVTGPLVARRFRFPMPGCLAFATPAGWLGMWACVPSHRWPFTSVTTNVAILLLLYCLAAWLASRSTR